MAWPRNPTRLVAEQCLGCTCRNTQAQPPGKAPAWLCMRAREQYTPDEKRARGPASGHGQIRYACANGGGRIAKQCIKCSHAHRLRVEGASAKRSRSDAEKLFRNFSRRQTQQKEQGTSRPGDMPWGGRHAWEGGRLNRLESVGGRGNVVHGIAAKR